MIRHVGGVLKEFRSTASGQLDGVYKGVCHRIAGHVFTGLENKGSVNLQLMSDQDRISAELHEFVQDILDEWGVTKFLWGYTMDESRCGNLPNPLRPDNGIEALIRNDTKVFHHNSADGDYLISPRVQPGEFGVEND